MSESIFTILGNGQSVTKVKGYGDYNMTLPATMPTPEEFSSATELAIWADDNGVMHSCLQKGVQKHLIDLRAKFRGVKKDESWQVDTAQKNVDESEWGVVTPVASGKVDQARQAGHLAAGLAMAGAMKAAGLDDAMILAALVPVYGADIAASIMEELAEQAEQEE